MWHKHRAQSIHQEENEWKALSFCICTMTLTTVGKNLQKSAEKKRVKLSNSQFDGF
jgi:hypothetical protein